jgi:hypothetical protein
VDEPPLLDPDFEPALLDDPEPELEPEPELDPDPELEPPEPLLDELDVAGVLLFV